MLALFYFAFLLTVTSSWSIKAPPKKLGSAKCHAILTKQAWPNTHLLQ